VESAELRVYDHEAALLHSQALINREKPREQPSSITAVNEQLIAPNKGDRATSQATT
jgi:hypothetical protein